MRPRSSARHAALSSGGRASLVAASVAVVAAVAPAACNALTGVGDYQFGDFSATGGGGAAASSRASTGTGAHTASASHGSGSGSGGMEPCGGAPATSTVASTGHGGGAATSTSTTTTTTATATSAAVTSGTTTTTTGGAGGGGGGAPAMCSGPCGCCNCDDFLQGKSANGTLCQGSQSLGLDLGVCVCQGSTTCYQPGNGGGGPTGACADLCTTQTLPPSDACLQCAKMACHQQYNACEDDPG